MGFPPDNPKKETPPKPSAGNSAHSLTPIESLSNRELEVFRLLGAGRSTRQISEALQINFKTVQTNCARIKRKLQLANFYELMREAIRWHDRHG